MSRYWFRLAVAGAGHDVPRHATLDSSPIRLVRPATSSSASTSRLPERRLRGVHRHRQGNGACDAAGLLGAARRASAVGTPARWAGLGGGPEHPAGHARQLEGRRSGGVLSVWRAVRRLVALCNTARRSASLWKVDSFV